MSCYICEKETFIKVLKAWSVQGEALRHMPDEKELTGAWLEIVGANYDAYNNRYPNHKLEPRDDLNCPVSTTDMFYLDYNKKELYDALKEYMYQVADLDNYASREAYYKCRWCLNTMLDDYINEEFGEE